MAGPILYEVPEPSGPIAGVGEEIPGVLGGPRSVRMCGGAEDVDGAAVDLEDDEHADPEQCDRPLDVEEVAGHGVSYSWSTPPRCILRASMEVSGLGLIVPRRRCHPAHIRGS